jgi:hypothetical protein
MYRGSQKNFFTVPVLQVPNRTDADKNTLTTILSDYLTKKKDKAATLTSLIDLEIKLAIPS